MNEGKHGIGFDENPFWHSKHKTEVIDGAFMGWVAASLYHATEKAKLRERIAVLERALEASLEDALVSREFGDMLEYDGYIAKARDELTMEKPE